MSARAVPCEVPAIKRNIASGWKQPAGSCTKANRAGIPLKEPKMGFHCFRRFRESVLQKSEARALLVDYWMGHENREMGTRYAKQLVEDVARRKQWAKKVGLGFKLTDLQLEVGQLGQLSASKTQPAKAA
jgi:hypothetical protein